MAQEDADDTDTRIGPYLERPSGPRNPLGKFTYMVRGRNRSIETTWDKLCASSAGPARRCFDHLARTPKDSPIDYGRVTPLDRGRYAGTGLYQYEVTGAGRVWYKVDEQRRIVRVYRVDIGHPKETES